MQTGSNDSYVMNFFIEATTLRQINWNKFLKSVLDQVREFSTLGERVVAHKETKEALSEIFGKL